MRAQRGTLSSLLLVITDWMYDKWTLPLFNSSLGLTFRVCFPKRFRRATTAASRARLGTSAAIQTCTTVERPRQTSEVAVSP